MIIDIPYIRIIAKLIDLFFCEVFRPGFSFSAHYAFLHMASKKKALVRAFRTVMVLYALRGPV